MPMGTILAPARGKTPRLFFVVSCACPRAALAPKAVDKSPAGCSNWRNKAMEATQPSESPHPATRPTTAAASPSRDTRSGPGQDDSVFFLVYSSVATRAFTEPELRDLVARSRSKNLGSGVTGILLHDEGSFMQLLEGPEEAVRELYARIQGDSRHRRLRLLVQGHSRRRHICDWNLVVRTGVSVAGTPEVGRYDARFPWETPEFPADTPVAPCLRAFRKVAWWAPL
jgi:hypothetical protein